MRKAEITRKTAETDISLILCLDGEGKSNIKTGCGFLDHMLTLFAKHGRFNLDITCAGDIYVDDHHTVEDIGIALGQAFSQALADKKGIVRYGNMLLPMDESLVLSAVDFSGRSHLEYDVTYSSEKIGTFDVELVEEFWFGFVRNCNCTLHIKKISGINSHHIAEAVFKSVARSLSDGAKINKEFADEIPSTKGVL